MAKFNIYSPLKLMLLYLCFLSNTHSMEPVKKKAKCGEEMLSPKSLVDLCVPAVLKLKDIPIEKLSCFRLLGLVELERTQENSALREDLGSKEIEEKEFININYKEHFTKKTFKELITEQYNKNLPYILAVVTTKKKGKYTHTYYDAHSLNRSLFSSVNRYVYNTNRKFQDAVLSQPIINEIKYFIIDSPETIKAKFLGTDYDLYIDEDKKVLFDLFFKANQDSKLGQCQLGIFYDREGEIESAKYYYALGALKGCVTSQFNLACIYQRQGNIDQARRYCTLAAGQGNTRAQGLLGDIYYGEGDMEKAKHYYIILDKKDLGDQSELRMNVNFNLASIYEIEGNLGQAKRYYNSVTGKSCAEAEFRLAAIYEKENDIERAKKFYNWSANNGHIEAKVNLGLIYKAEADISQAKKYLTDAAKSNSSRAQYQLGLIYKEEADKSYAQSRHYFSRAFDNGVSEALEYLDLEENS